MTTKRHQTMAKITRERNVREKRERKLEKKRAAAAEKKARAAGTWIETEDELETSDEELEASDEEQASPSDEEEALPALLDPHQTNGDDGAVLGERVVPGL
jgi:hypothetical protein